MLDNLVDTAFVCWHMACESVLAKPGDAPPSLFHRPGLIGAEDGAETVSKAGSETSMDHFDGSGQGVVPDIDAMLYESTDDLVEVLSVDERHGNYHRTVA